MINVYSEIGKLKKVLVHTPGDELNYLTPSRLDELLFSAILDNVRSIEEHKEFIKLLKNEGVEVIQLSDLVAETYNYCNSDEKNDFINQFLDEAKPALNSDNREIVKKYLLSLEKDTVKMIRKMMSGITSKELGIKSNIELIVDPIPNLYFTRDPFASIGNGICLNHMFSETRRRETLFSSFIFSKHPEYKKTPLYYDRNNQYSIEGGDIFIYNEKTLVIGHSQRTSKEAIQLLAENIKKNHEIKFETIYVVNVPKMSNLMHLDTWLTMLDRNKFLYSPNMESVLKLWKIDLKKEKIIWEELSQNLQQFLSAIIGEEAILIPVAGKDASHVDIDVETNFDATNYLVLQPGVVIGYDRNRKTNLALEKAGIKVITWNGDQLSLGMGSARCMSMPLYRENLK